jgi:hypothetical protein
MEAPVTACLDVHSRFSEGNALKSSSWTELAEAWHHHLDPRKIVVDEDGGVKVNVKLLDNEVEMMDESSQETLQRLVEIDVIKEGNKDKTAVSDSVEDMTGKVLAAWDQAFPEVKMEEVVKLLKFIQKKLAEDHCIVAHYKRSRDH